MASPVGVEEGRRLWAGEMARPRGEKGAITQGLRTTKFGGREGETYQFGEGGLLSKPDQP